MEIIENRFQHCVKCILDHEGGLSNDHHDPGGITNFGISLRFLKSINPNAIPADIIGLTKADAINLYRLYWWDKYRYAAFNDLIVVEKVFDMAVNFGAQAAHTLLQRSINHLVDANNMVVVDGLLGGKTFGAANALDADKLRQALRESAKDRYLHILAAKPAMKGFIKGWLRRAAW